MLEILVRSLNNDTLNQMLAKNLIEDKEAFVKLLLNTHEENIVKKYEIKIKKAETYRVSNLLKENTVSCIYF